MVNPNGYRQSRMVGIVLLEDGAVSILRKRGSSFGHGFQRDYKSVSLSSLKRLTAVRDFMYKSGLWAYSRKGSPVCGEAWLPEKDLAIPERVKWKSGVMYSGGRTDIQEVLKKLKKKNA